MTTPEPLFNYPWPNETFDTISGRKKFSKLVDMPSEALAAGCFRSLQYQPDYQEVPRSIQMQIEHYAVVFHALTASGNLKQILDFVEAVLLHLERGILHWDSRYEAILQQITLAFLTSLRESRESTPKPFGLGNKDQAKTASNVCRKFNLRGGCTKATPGGSHQGMLHVCDQCYKRDRPPINHSNEDCVFFPQGPNFDPTGTARNKQ